MIVFVQVPGFYAAVEQADEAELRGRAVIVGGDPRKRGVVTGASREARARGVSEGVPVADALARCPDALLRPTRLRRYREVAAEVRAVLRQGTDRLEELGLGGAYLEFADGVDTLARSAELCVRLQAELGLGAVAGIGPTRFVAYMAAQHPGRSGIRVVDAASAPEFLSAFPVTELWGLGPATAEKLLAERVETIGDLRRLPRDRLEELVGRNARSFTALALAEDREPLRPSPRPKTLSQERTLGAPTLDLGTLGEVLAETGRRLEATLEREQCAARTVSLRIHYADEGNETRTSTLPGPISTAHEIRDAALELLARTQATVRPVRRLRLQVARLAPPRPDEDPRQLRLF